MKAPVHSHTATTLSVPSWMVAVDAWTPLTVRRAISLRRVVIEGNPSLSHW